MMALMILRGRIVDIFRCTAAGSPCAVSHPSVLMPTRTTLSQQHYNTLRTQLLCSCPSMPHCGSCRFLTRKSHGSYCSAEFTFPDFPGQNESFSLTNLFTQNTSVGFQSLAITLETRVVKQS